MLASPPMENKKKKVLIVDDNDDICDVFKFHFEHKGFETFLAGNGKDAFACLTLQQPSLMISDIRMPDGDGLELLERMRREYDGREQPVVVLMSGFAEGLNEAACELGAEVVLSKPFEFEDLYKQVENSLLPLEEQWDSNRNSPIERKNFYISSDLSDQPFLVHSKKFSLGRTGFFIAFDSDSFPEPESLTTFKIQFQDRLLQGIGRVRWIRTKATHDGHPAGLGVRILKLEDDCRADVIKQVKEVAPKSFIPRF